MYNLDIKGFFYKIYTVMISVLIFNILTTSFGFTWSEIANTIKFVAMIVVTIFTIVYFSTNMLMFNFKSSMQNIVENTLTADFLQVMDFWEQANIFSKNTIVTFGSILAITMVLETIFM